MPSRPLLALLLFGCSPRSPDDPAAVVDIIDSALQLGCASPYTLPMTTDGSVVFSTSDPDVVAVDASGTLVPGYIGTATVRAEAPDDPSVFDEVTVEVVSSFDVFVDAAADPAVADGSPERPLRYIDTDPLVFCSGGTLHLAAGVYAQRLGIGGPLTLRGPDAWPPTAVLRAWETDYPGSVIGAQGHEQGLAFTIENVHVDGSGVDERVLTPTSFLWFRGLMLDGNVDATVRRSLFTGFQGEAAGDDNGICIHAIDSTVTIEDSEFRDCGWRAVATLQITGDHPSAATVRDSVFVGSAPATSGVSATQTALWVHDGATGEATGNTFRGFGPAGPANAAYGGARVTDTGGIGWAIEAPATGFVVTGNTFEDVQGLLRVSGTGGLTAAKVLADNTVVGRSITLGRPAEAAEIRGQRADDPNHLNAALLDLPCDTLTHCEITLSPGDWTLTEALVDPGFAVTLVSSGTSTVTIPNATVPANVVAGAGVTITPTSQ